MFPGISSYQVVAKEEKARVDQFIHKCAYLLIQQHLLNVCYVPRIAKLIP